MERFMLWALKPSPYESEPGQDFLGSILAWRLLVPDPVSLPSLQAPPEEPPPPPQTPPPINRMDLNLCLRICI